MEDDCYEEMGRCVSDPQGDHSWRALHGGLSTPPENRRCHSLSQLALLETVVYEMEDRCVWRAAPRRTVGRTFPGGRAPRSSQASLSLCCGLLC